MNNHLLRAPASFFKHQNLNGITQRSWSYTPLRQFLFPNTHHFIRLMSTKYAEGGKDTSSTRSTKDLYSSPSLQSSLVTGPSSSLDVASLNERLQTLVARSSLGAADRLRIHLLSTSVSISPHPIYEKAALESAEGWVSAAANGGAEKTGEMERALEAFVTWFEFIPNASESRSVAEVASFSPFSSRIKDNRTNRDAPFALTLRTLIHTGAPASRLELILHFGILTAGKGFVAPVFSEVLPLLARLRASSAYSAASASISQQQQEQMKNLDSEMLVRWMYDVECAYVSYHSDHDRDVEGARQRMRAYVAHFCAKSGWLEEAFMLMSIPREFALLEKTYWILERKLQEAGNFREAMEVRAWRKRDVFFDGKYGFGAAAGAEWSPKRWAKRELGIKPKKTEEKEKQLPTRGPRRRGNPLDFAPSSLTFGDTQVSRRDVAKRLRKLKYAAVHAQDDIEWKELTSFFVYFGAVGGSRRVLGWLRRRVINRRIAGHGKIPSTSSVGSMWLHTEMLAYNAVRDYEAILKLFLVHVSATEAVAESDEKDTIPPYFKYVLGKLDTVRGLARGGTMTKEREAARCTMLRRSKWIVLKAIVHLAVDSLPAPLDIVQKLYDIYLTGVRSFPASSMPRYSLNYWQDKAEKAVQAKKKVAANLNKFRHLYDRTMASIGTLRELNEVLSTFITAFAELQSLPSSERVYYDHLRLFTPNPSTNPAPSQRLLESLCFAYAACSSSSTPSPQLLYPSFAPVTYKISSASTPAHQAFFILDSIENGMLPVLGPTGTIVKAKARIATYGLVIEGFLIAGRTREARQVEIKMRDALKRDGLTYEIGGNRRLDMTIGELGRLEMCQQRV